MVLEWQGCLVTIDGKTMRARAVCRVTTTPDGQNLQYQIAVQVFSITKGERDVHVHLPHAFFSTKPSFLDSILALSVSGVWIETGDGKPITKEWLDSVEESCA